MRWWLVLNAMLFGSLASAQIPASIDRVFNQNPSVKELRNSQSSFVFMMPTAPKNPLDLRSGEHLKMAVVKQLGESNKLEGGHVVFGWSCYTAGSRREYMTGMTGESVGQAAKLLRSGWGFTSFLATFLDGRMQDTQAVESFLTQSILTNEDPKESGILVIEVDAEDCANGERFILAFQQSPNGASRRFGSMVDPLRFEGGGCVSVAHAFLVWAGVFPQTLKAWWRDLLVPVRLMGKGAIDSNGIPLNTAGNGEPIQNVILPMSLLDHNAGPIGIFRFQNSIWNSDIREPVVHLPQVDPEAVTFFVRTVVRKLDQRRVAQGLQPRGEWERLVRLAFQDREMTLIAPNTVPLQYVHTVLDVNFDRFHGRNFARIDTGVDQEIDQWSAVKSTYQGVGRKSFIVVLRK